MLYLYSRRYSSSSDWESCPPVLKRKEKTVDGSVKRILIGHWIEFYRNCFYLANDYNALIYSSTQFPPLHLYMGVNLVFDRLWTFTIADDNITFQKDQMIKFKQRNAVMAVIKKACHTCEGARACELNWPENGQFNNNDNKYSQKKYDGFGRK